MFPRVDRQRVFRKHVVRTAQGSLVALAAWANRLPVASHCQTLLMHARLLLIAPARLTLAPRRYVEEVECGHCVSAAGKNSFEKVHDKDDAGDDCDKKSETAPDYHAAARRNCLGLLTGGTSQRLYAFDRRIAIEYYRTFAVAATESTRLPQFEKKSFDFRRESAPTSLGLLVGFGRALSVVFAKATTSGSPNLR